MTKYFINNSSCYLQLSLISAIFFNIDPDDNVNPIEKMEENIDANFPSVHRNYENYLSNELAPINVSLFPIKNDENKIIIIERDVEILRRAYKQNLLHTPEFKKRFNEMLDNRITRIIDSILDDARTREKDNLLNRHA